MATARLQQYDSATQARAVKLSTTDSHSSFDEFDLPQEIRLSQRDFKLFLVEIERDEEPNELLVACAAEYKQNFR
jgi:hypothetical protein